MFETPTTDKALIERLEKELEICEKNAVIWKQEKMELSDKLKELEAKNKTLMTKIIILENDKSSKQEGKTCTSTEKLMEILKGLSIILFKKV